jgi:hypothetical protein
MGRSLVISTGRQLGVRCQTNKAPAGRHLLIKVFMIKQIFPVERDSVFLQQLNVLIRKRAFCVVFFLVLNVFPNGFND